MNVTWSTVPESYYSRCGRFQVTPDYKVGTFAPTGRYDLWDLAGEGVELVGTYETLVGAMMEAERRWREAQQGFGKLHR